MILAGVPFDNPTEFIELENKESAEHIALIVKPRKPSIGYVTLKIDVSQLGISAIEYLSSVIRKYLAVQIIGGDILYATGKISSKDYNKIWSTLDSFQCKVIC